MMFGTNSIFVALAATCLMLSSAYAGIRVTGVDHSKYINPEAVERIADVFDPVPGALFRVAGGVILDGSAAFYLEGEDSADLISPSQVTLQIENELVFLVHDGVSFALEIHHGIACPLGEFVQRGGIIAFTIPPMSEAEDIERLVAEGIVEGGYAREFMGTPFEGLFYGMDFAAPAPLPDGLSDRIVDAVSIAAGLIQDSVSSIGSYVNSDQQVEYQVYLMVGSNEVEVAGAPLRYDWDWQTNGQPRINFVTGWSLEFEQDRVATVGAEPFGQYDYVNAAQVAGIFRELSRTNPSNFSTFVSDACRDR